MKLYHATTVGGLRVLKANSRDREGNPVLYLTDNFPYSLFYIRDREIDFVTCGVRQNGIVHYDEKFPNQLETLYHGLSGWVYEVDVEARPTGINSIFTAFGEVTVCAKRYVPDVLQAIREEIQKSNVHFLSYRELTEAQKQLNREGIIRFFIADRNFSSKKTMFFREHFPEEWEEAQNILAQF